MKQIYGLMDPNTRTIRYVGQAKNAHERLKVHMRRNDESPVSQWLQQLKKQGKVPVLFIFEEVSDDRVSRTERKYIGSFFNLLNLLGNPEQKDRVRETYRRIRLGKKDSDHTKELKRLASSKRTHSEETRQKIENAIRGRTKANGGRR